MATTKSNSKLPETMKALVFKNIVTDFQKKGEIEKSLVIENVPRPVPSYNNVVIKVQRAQIEPSDITYLQGQYGKQPDLTKPAGFSCVGTVVDHGASPFAWMLLGKRVAVGGAPGAWAEYMVADANHCLVLHDSSTWENGAGSIVNPFTVLLMIDHCHRERYVVMNAAFSDLGKKFVRAAAKKGIKTIAIVRKQEQISPSQLNGAFVTLNSSSPSFLNELTQLCLEHHVRIAFDPVGGETGTQIFSALLPGAEMFVFANLSEKPLTPSANDLIFKKKTLKGLWAEEVYELNVFKLLEMKHQVTSMLDNEFKTEVQNTFPLENYREAFEAYLSNQSGGKVQFIIGDAEAVPVRVVCEDGKAATGLPVLPTENKRKAHDVFGHDDHTTTEKDVLGHENRATTTGKDAVLGYENKATTTYPAGHTEKDVFGQQDNKKTTTDVFGQQDKDVFGQQDNKKTTSDVFGQSSSTTGNYAGYTDLSQNQSTTTSVGTDTTTSKPLPSSSQWLESYKASDAPGTVHENRTTTTDPLPSSSQWLESYKASDPPKTDDKHTTTGGNYPGYTELNQQNQTTTFPSASQYTAGQTTTGTYQDLKVKEEKDKNVIL